MTEKQNEALNDFSTVLNLVNARLEPNRAEYQDAKQAWSFLYMELEELNALRRFKIDTMQRLDYLSHTIEQFKNLS